MSVANILPYVTYVANGTTTSFSIPFDYAYDSDVNITIDGVAPDVGVVSLVDNNMVFNKAPVSGTVIYIYRETPQVRETDYDNHDNVFRPRVVNKDFDRIWYVIQEFFKGNLDLWEALKKEIQDRKDGDDLILDGLAQEIQDRIKGDEDLKKFIISMIDEAIEHGLASAVAVTHVSSISELNELANKWDTRTVYVKDIGMYQYNGTTEAWESLSLNSNGWTSRADGYPLNARLQLDNGDIVRSTVANNTVNPNSDMTGWVKVNSASQIVESSGLTQQQFNDVITYKEIYLSRLGAKFDGTDESAILQAAIDASDNYTTIVFDKTGFMFSTVDFGTKAVSLRGIPTIDDQLLPIMVKISGAGIVCNTQKVKYAYIDFRSTGNKSDGENINLMTNSKNNGVWLWVKNCRAYGFSGHVLQGIDLIDSKIDGFVADHNNKVFYFTIEEWVASTTIQFNKVYAQNNTIVFDADDCDHCSMYDCIFEFNASLGHIDNGDWVAINSYFENNSAPLTATNSYWLHIKQYNYKTNDQVVNTQPDVAPIDKGYTRINNRNIQTSQLIKGFERMTALTPSFSGQTWTKLGTAYLTQGGTIQIEIIGSASYTQPSTPSNIQAVGKTIIIAQAKNSSQSTAPNIHATWHNVGVSTGVSQCRFVQNGTSTTNWDVYILQDSSAYIGFKVDLNKGDYFDRDVQLKQEKPTGGGTGDVNTATMLIAFPYARIQSGTGYVGSDGVNPILGGVSATTVGATGTAAALPANPVGYVSVNINGTVYKMPYYNV